MTELVCHSENPQKESDTAVLSTEDKENVLREDCAPALVSLNKNNVCGDKQEEHSTECSSTHNLVLSLNSDFEEITHQLDTLNQHSSIKTLTLTSSDCGEPEPDWNSDAVREFFLDIAALLSPNLECLSLNNFGMHCNSVPIHLLTVLLTNNNNNAAQRIPTSLRQLQLNCVCLIGNQADAMEMAHQIQHQTQLESFQMSYCGFSTTMMMDSLSSSSSSSSCTSILDPIVMALASLPLLKTVEIWSYADGKLGTLKADTMKHLIQRCPHLQTLHIEGFLLGDDQVQAIASTLHEDTSSLKRLYLHKLKQAPVGSLALAESLRHNTSLRYMELFLSNTCDTDDYDGQQHQQQDDGFLSQMALALAGNTDTSLQEFRVHSYRKVTALEEEAFATMLETNSSLRYLHLAGYEGDGRPKIEYYLSWNRRGRNSSRILQNCCKISATVKSRQQQEKESEDPQTRKSKRRARGLMRP